MFRDFSFPGPTAYVERAAEVLGVRPERLGLVRDNAQIRRIGSQISQSESYSDDMLVNILRHAESERDLLAVALMAADMMMSEARDEHGIDPWRPAFVVAPSDAPSPPRLPFTEGDSVRLRETPEYPPMIADGFSADMKKCRCIHPSAGVAEWIEVADLEKSDDDMGRVFRLGEGHVADLTPHGRPLPADVERRTSRADIDIIRRTAQVEASAATGEVTDVGQPGIERRRKRGGGSRGLREDRPDADALVDPGRPEDDRETLAKPVDAGGNGVPDPDRKEADREIGRSG